MAVAPHQIEIALRADLRRRDLRIHVADHEVGDADIVAHDLPDRFVAPPLLHHLDGLELQTFRVRVDRVDNAAASRRVRADIEMVRGGDRKAD